MITKYKVVKDFKRGDPIPENSKYLSSRLYRKTEHYDDGHPQDWGTRVVEEYYIDTYEIEIN
jgi:hypothetical protein